MSGCSVSQSSSPVGSPGTVTSAGTAVACNCASSHVGAACQGRGVTVLWNLGWSGVEKLFRGGVLDRNSKTQRCQFCGWCQEQHYRMDQEVSP